MSGEDPLMSRANNPEKEKLEYPTQSHLRDSKQVADWDPLKKQGSVRNTLKTPPPLTRAYSDNQLRMISQSNQELPVSLVLKSNSDLSDRIKRNAGFQPIQQKSMNVFRKQGSSEDIEIEQDNHSQDDSMASDHMTQSIELYDNPPNISKQINEEESPQERVHSNLIVASNQKELESNSANVFSKNASELTEEQIKSLCRNYPNYTRFETNQLYAINDEFNKMQYVKLIDNPLLVIKPLDLEKHFGYLDGIEKKALHTLLVEHQGQIESGHYRNISWQSSGKKYHVYVPHRIRLLKPRYKKESAAYMVEAEDAKKLKNLLGLKSRGKSINHFHHSQPYPVTIKMSTEERAQIEVVVLSHGVTKFVNRKKVKKGGREPYWIMNEKREDRDKVKNGSSGEFKHAMRLEERKDKSSGNTYFLLQDRTGVKKIKKSNETKNHMYDQEYQLFKKMNQTEAPNQDASYKYATFDSKDRIKKFCITMPYFGENLKEIIEKNQLPSVLADRLEIAIQAAEALKKLHDEGYVHRDVKLSNFVMDRKDGKVRLIDFGDACKTEKPKSFAQDKALVGTPIYMAPELAFKNKNDYHHYYYKSDVYGLSAVIWCVVYGNKDIFQNKETPQDETKYTIFDILYNTRGFKKSLSSVEEAVMHLIEEAGQQSINKRCSLDKVIRKLKLIRRKAVYQEKIKEFGDVEVYQGLLGRINKKQGFFSEKNIDAELIETLNDYLELLCKSTNKARAVDCYQFRKSVMFVSDLFNNLESADLTHQEKQQCLTRFENKLTANGQFKTGSVTAFLLKCVVIASMFSPLAFLVYPAYKKYCAERALINRLCGFIRKAYQNNYRDVNRKSVLFKKKAISSKSGPPSIGVSTNKENEELRDSKSSDEYYEASGHLTST